MWGQCCFSEKPIRADRNVKENPENMTDAERWGRASTSTSDEKLEEPRRMVHEDIRATIVEIA
jgi:hypothetical protein